MTSDLNTALHSVERADYGENYQGHYLELYKLYVDSAHKISAMRGMANSFFVAISTGIVAAVAYFDKISNTQNVLVNLAGILICYVWWRLMVSYRQMNTGKFKVIHEMERQLPLAVFDAEWDALGRGEDKKLYKQFTVVEALVPLIFAALFCALLVRGFLPKDEAEARESTACIISVDQGTLKCEFTLVPE